MQRCCHAYGHCTRYRDRTHRTDGTFRSRIRTWRGTPVLMRIKGEIQQRTRRRRDSTLTKAPSETPSIGPGRIRSGKLPP